MCLCSTSGSAISSVTVFGCHDKGGCDESTHTTDCSGADSPQRRFWLCADWPVLRQGQSPAAASCYQRLELVGGPAIVPVPFFLGAPARTKGLDQGPQVLARAATTVGVRGCGLCKLHNMTTPGSVIRESPRIFPERTIPIASVAPPTSEGLPFSRTPR